MLGTIPSEQARQISDLAANLTDQALEAVSKKGVRGDSVALELSLWRALSAELYRNVHYTPQPLSQDVSAFRGVVEDVVQRTVAKATPGRAGHTDWRRADSAMFRMWDGPV